MFNEIDGKCILEKYLKSEVYRGLWIQVFDLNSSVSIWKCENVLWNMFHVKFNVC